LVEAEILMLDPLLRKKKEESAKNLLRESPEKLLLDEPQASFWTLKSPKMIREELLINDNSSKSVRIAYNRI